jgi:hypothetical protein
MKTKYRFIAKTDPGSSPYYETQKWGGWGGWKFVDNSLSHDKDKAWGFYLRIIKNDFKPGIEVLHELPEGLTDAQAIEAWLRLNEPDK